MGNPSFTTWVAWIAATVVAALTMTAGAFTTFQTKEEAREVKSDVVERLVRIENKLDAYGARK